MTQAKQLTERDLQEAFLKEHTGKQWDDLSISLKLTYEKVTQALNIKLGLLTDSMIEYLFVFEGTVTRASGPESITSLIEQHVPPGNIFQVVMIQAGHSVGHGHYQLLQDRTLWEESCEGQTQGLLGDKVQGQALERMLFFTPK